MATRVGTGTANSPAGADASIASTAKATTTGNLQVAFFKWENDVSLPTGSSIADTAGNTGWVIADQGTNGADQADLLAYCPNATGNAANVVTLTLSTTGGSRRAMVEEFSGIALASPTDGAVQTSTGTTGTYTTSNIATTRPGLVFMGIGEFTALGTLSGTPGNPDFTVGATASDAFVAFLISTSAQTVTPGADSTAFSKNRTIALAFKDAPLGGSKAPQSQITLNPGGVPVGPTPMASPGRAPSYGAVRWQAWENYPWGPFVAAVAPTPPMVVLLSRQSPRLYDDVEDYQPAKPPSLHSFRRTFQTVGQSYVVKYPLVSKRLDEEDYGQPKHNLHIFRVGYQTVGQPWLMRYRRNVPTIDAEEYSQPPISQAILFGRTTPAATQRQPLMSVWQTRRLDDAEEFSPRPADYFLLNYGRTQIVLVTQAYWVGPALAFGQVTDPEEYPQPKHNLHAFRATQTQQPAQPYVILARRGPPLQAEEVEEYRPIDVSKLRRNTPTAGAGQPWYLWKPWPLKFEDMTYEQPYDVPPFNPWMIMRNTQPIVAPPPGVGEYIIRQRRRRRR